MTTATSTKTKPSTDGEGIISPCSVHRPDGADDCPSCEVHAEDCLCPNCSEYRAHMGVLVDEQNRFRAERQPWIDGQVNEYLDLMARHESEQTYRANTPSLGEYRKQLPIRTQREGDEHQAKDATALEKALCGLGIDLRYNVRSAKVEYRHWEQDWHELDDRTEAKLRDAVSVNYSVKTTRGKSPLRFGREAWADAANAIIYTKQVDPFKEYLESLPAWDGVERCGSWLSLTFTVDTDYAELATWAGCFMFLGAVWRAFEPACKMDELPVLIGRGGIGKSSAMAALLPPELGDMFTDSLRFDMDGKEKVESLQGRVLVEAAELAGMSKADLSAMKAFISRTTDSVRLSYRHNPETFPRRAVIIGTSDTETPLPNDTNLRRFVPVKLLKGNPSSVVQYIDRNRAQLWAEALSMYRSGITAHLPDELKDDQCKAAERARSSDVMLEDGVAKFLENAPESFPLVALATALNLTVNTESGARVNPQETRRMVHALRLHGYSQVVRWIDGKTQRLWTKEG